MPRKLPWLQDSAQKKVKRASPVRKQPQKPVETRYEGRTPSTSPPPAPPIEEYMIDGLEHDDIYIMVEDELTATAGLFTRHLHHAEYLRLKHAAEQRGGRAGLDLEPVLKETVVKSDNTRRRRGHSIGDADDEEGEEEDDDPWIGTPLHTLMTRKAHGQVLHVEGRSPQTTKIQKEIIPPEDVSTTDEDEDDEDSDDLDVPTWKDKKTGKAMP